MKKLLLLASLLIVIQSCKKKTYNLNLQVLKACELFQKVKEEKGYKISRENYFKDYRGEDVNPKTKQAFTINNEDLEQLKNNIDKLIIGANLYNISNDQISEERRGDLKLTKTERDNFYKLLLETCEDFQEIETEIAKKLDIYGLQYRTRRNDDYDPPRLITVTRRQKNRVVKLEEYLQEMKEIEYKFSNYGSSLIKFIGQTPNEKSKSKPKPKINSNFHKNDASLENSKRVYNMGYSDGQMAYGLPASQRASAFEVHMAKGYNFSGKDYLVYKMGYDDGQFGRKKRKVN